VVKTFSNKQIAELFRQVAAAYTIKGGNTFKIIAYENAADSIEHATSEIKDLWELDKLNSLPAIGASIREHLTELFTKGKVKHFEEIKKGIDPFVFELMNVRGMGPKTAFNLVTKLKIKTKQELVEKAKKGEVRKLTGFGEKSEKEIIEAIGSYKEQTRFLIVEAFNVAERVLAYLRSIKETERAEPLGSLRRMVATVGDIDIAVASNYPAKVISHFKKFKEIAKLLEAGPRKASAILIGGMQVDLMVEEPDAFGALLQHFTGSKYHNIHLRELAIKIGYSLSDYGIKKGNKLLKFKTEEEFYKFLNMDWIIPEMREDTGEIEAALTHKLPNTVKIEEIKGDIHLHSNYPIEPSHDLGTCSFHQIIEKAIEFNYEYVGLSDHSPSVSTHSIKQILKLIEARSKKIEQIKNSGKRIGVLNLLEIDILTNGKLSVPIEGLKMLDGAIAGIHSSHFQDKKTITKRLMTAIHSPYVQVISHPTGRLLLKRESYEADWVTIFKECAKTDTMLEINAWPNRMDLFDSLVRQAIGAKVRLIINTDSHAIDQMDNMRFGVAVAQRGWATKQDIANTLPWPEFKRLFNYH